MKGEIEIEAVNAGDKIKRPRKSVFIASSNKLYRPSLDINCIVNVIREFAYIINHYTQYCNVQNVCT